MTELTVVMAVYGQPLMLAAQLATIRGYGPETRSRLNVVVVDDCGDPAVDPEDIGFLASFVKSVKLFRVDKDIPWNQMGARNLGMQHSEGHCLLIDPDMVFDGVVMARMIEAASKLARGRVIKWGLRHVNTGKLDMSSPNTWLLHRDDFFAVGGYDEDFAGNKGWSDVQFLDIMRGCYKIEERPDLWAHFHSTASVPDAMVTSLDRSTAANRKKRVKKVEQARKAGGWARWAKTRVSAERLRFPWTQLFPKHSETSARKS
jgi:hypothetical protein